MLVLNAWVSLEAKIEECMAKQYSGSAITSACVEGFLDATKPSFITPDVCTSGVKSILHPNDKNFNETEYASQSIVAGPCMASCCELELYHWQTYTNAFVTSDHYMYDTDSGRVVSYTDMAEAKQACETMGSVLCFGIYDANCDGPSYENPVKIVKAPGIDLESVKESSVGSCVQKLMNGPGTTMTTTTVKACIYEVQYTSSGAPDDVKTLTVEHQEYGEAFRFSGCDNEELDEGKACVSSGAQNGVRLLKNRYGQAVATGTCCTSETNKVILSEPTQCDGYKDEYKKYDSVYLTASKLIRGTSYHTLREAQIACLKMGHKCWGLFDDKCDLGNLMLVDGDLNISTSVMRESHQSSCFERSHGPTDPSRFHPRHGPSGLSVPAPASPERTAGSSAFAGGFSPSFNSTRMAMALGAISSEPTEEEGLLYAEMGGGLFAPLASPRPPAGGRLRGGYRPFLRSDLDQYQAQVDEFREKSHCAAAAIRAGRRCNGPPAPAGRQRQLSARLARARRRA
eukprot:s527_g24.t1